MSKLIGRMAKCYENGEEFAHGEIVFVCENSIWILQDSGFILRCNPNSIKLNAID